MSRPTIIKARVSSMGVKPFVLLFLINQSRQLPKSAKKLADGVWFMPKGPNNEAQSIIKHDDWTYFVFAKEWNANNCINPKVEILESMK